MKKTKPAANPDAYVESLDGWQQGRVIALRKSVRSAKSLVEEIKWGHLVYSTTGPVLLIRAEPQRVLFGFWRGKRLISIEPRLKPSGKYEMATLEFREETTIKPAVVRRLVSEAVSLNQQIGDPRLAAKRTRKPAAKRTLKPAAKTKRN